MYSMPNFRPRHRTKPAFHKTHTTTGAKQPHTKTEYSPSSYPRLQQRPKPGRKQRSTPAVNNIQNRPSATPKTPPSTTPKPDRQQR